MKKNGKVELTRSHVNFEIDRIKIDIDHLIDRDGGD